MECFSFAAIVEFYFVDYLCLLQFLVFCFSQDGRLQAGDQLLEVDGKGLVGLSQDK